MNKLKNKELVDDKRYKRIFLLAKCYPQLPEFDMDGSRFDCGFSRGSISTRVKFRMRRHDRIITKSYDDQSQGF